MFHSICLTYVSKLSELLAFKANYKGTKGIAFIDNEFLNTLKKFESTIKDDRLLSMFNKAADNLKETGNTEDLNKVYLKLIEKLELKVDKYESDLKTLVTI